MTQRDEVLTVKETAKVLRMSENSVYETVKRGQLPGVIRLGRTIRISRSVLDGLLTTGGQVE
jgi:excisionase family DNA binding protein